MFVAHVFGGFARGSDQLGWRLAIVSADFEVSSRETSALHNVEMDTAAAACACFHFRRWKQTSTSRVAEACSRGDPGAFGTSAADAESETDADADADADAHAHAAVSPPPADAFEAADVEAAGKFMEIVCVC